MQYVKLSSASTVEVQMIKPLLELEWEANQDAKRKAIILVYLSSIAPVPFKRVERNFDRLSVFYWAHESRKPGKHIDKIDNFWRWRILGSSE